MATRTFTDTGGDHLWSNAANWDTGVPIDGDGVVIPSGKTCIFDVDQSAFTTGIGLTITGTLTHAVTGGPYTLMAKTGASIVGAGTWNIGTSANPVPFAVKHTITGMAGWYVDGNAGLTMTVYGAEPSIKYVKLLSDAAIGQTVLSVDTDITGDIWADGDIVRIDDINKAQESEERVIAGRAAGTITITAGLTAAKSAGAIISLITRNIKIVAVGTGSQTILRVSGANKLTIASGMWCGVNKIMLESCHYVTISGGTFSGNSYGLSTCASAVISGGTFSGNSYGLYTCASAVISGGTFSGNNYVLYYCTSAVISGGTFSGNNYVLYYCTSAVISGGTFSGNNYVLYYCTSAVILGGMFSGNNYGLYTCASAVILGGMFSGNIYGLYTCASAVILGGMFSGNSYDLRSTQGALYGIELTSAVEHLEYTLMQSTGVTNCQSNNHDKVAGAFKAWCRGGVVTSQNAVMPAGYSIAYLLDPESAVYPVFFTKIFTVSAGEIVDVEVQLRKDASMAYLPRVYLVKSIENPLAGSTPTDTFVMTDSTNMWESDVFRVDNLGGTYELEYCLYFVAQNATDNVYAAYKITPKDYRISGAVSISPR